MNQANHEKKESTFDQETTTDHSGFENQKTLMESEAILTDSDCEKSPPSWSWSSISNHSHSHADRESVKKDSTRSVQSRGTAKYSLAEFKAHLSLQNKHQGTCKSRLSNFCTLCGITCNSKIQLDEHTRGNIHAMNLSHDRSKHFANTNKISEELHPSDNNRRVNTASSRKFMPQASARRFRLVTGKSNPGFSGYAESSNCTNLPKPLNKTTKSSSKEYPKQRSEHNSTCEETLRTQPAKNERVANCTIQKDVKKLSEGTVSHSGSITSQKFLEKESRKSVEKLSRNQIRPFYPETRPDTHPNFGTGSRYRCEPSFSSPHFDPTYQFDHQFNPYGFTPVPYLYPSTSPENVYVPYNFNSLEQMAPAVPIFQTDQRFANYHPGNFKQECIVQVQDNHYGLSSAESISYQSPPSESRWQASGTSRSFKPADGYVAFLVWKPHGQITFSRGQGWLPGKINRSISY